jgi:hypothetical protein
MFKNKNEQRKHWMNYAEERLVGRTIKSVDWLPEDKDEPHFKRPIILHLDDGSYIFPTSDDEFNDGGALYGQSGDGDDWVFPVNGG